MATKKKLQSVTNARLSRIDRDIAWFRTSLERLGQRWTDEIDALLHDPTKANVTRMGYIVELQRQIQGQLNALGYEELAQQFVGKYDAGRQDAQKTLDALGVNSERIAPLDENLLQSLRDMDIAAFIGAGQSTVEEVSRGVLLNAIGGMKRSEMIRNIAKTVDSKLVNYSATYADTALVSYDRRVHWDTWKSAGIEKMLYRGPSDVKTRPFCEARVGKTFTAKEIDEMDNGTKLMPVSIYGGGYNCRHVWTPALVESGR